MVLRNEWRPRRGNGQRFCKEGGVGAVLHLEMQDLGCSKMRLKSKSPMETGLSNTVVFADALPIPFWVSSGGRLAD